MRRRQFISAVGGAAVAWPLAARGQQPVIGFLGATTPDRFAAFRQGLGEAGYVEGRNVVIEYRAAAGHYDQLPALAADLVRSQVTVIAAMDGTPSALAAKAVTTTIPIVFAVGIDPVEFGLVASLNHPGGNLTGITSLNVEVEPKRLELLHELVPAAASVAVLVNPTSIIAETQSKNLQAAARTLGVQLHILHASTDSDFETVFATLAQLRVGGLVIAGDVFFNNRTEQLASLAVRHAVPTIFQFREFTAAGGLMSYGPSFTDSYHLAGVYIGRVLKGEKPADLPVQQLTKIELFINLKTAKTLGITVPIPLSGRADEVIE